MFYGVVGRKSKQVFIKKSWWRSLLLGLFMLPLLSGCGEMVEIPPAHVGKLSTPDGLAPGIIPPSKIRLTSFCMVCDSIILAEASDYAIREQMTLYMPKDRLNLKVDLRGTFAISNKPANVEKIFARITAKRRNSRVSLISIKKVYMTYAQPVVRESARAVLAKYSIYDTLTKRDKISRALVQEVSQKLAGMPIQPIRLSVAGLQPPQVIIRAQEAAKERRIAIQRAEADKLVKLKEAEAALAVAIKQQQVDLKEAETQVLVNKKLAQGVNHAFIAQRSLRVLETLAASNNKVFFLPSEVMSNPALLLGTLQEGFKKSERSK
ncbi:SPFH domain-containing protein [Magnetococcales bacterium HHB-1]